MKRTRLLLLAVPLLFSPMLLGGCGGSPAAPGPIVNPPPPPAGLVNVGFALDKSPIHVGDAFKVIPYPTDANGNPANPMLLENHAFEWSMEGTDGTEHVQNLGVYLYDNPSSFYQMYLNLKATSPGTEIVRLKVWQGTNKSTPVLATYSIAVTIE